MQLPSAVDLLFARQVIDGTGVDYTAPPPDLTTLPANSLWATWRPEIHVLPPNGQIGDPCAHYNDPATGLFHVGFLHNGTGIAAVYTDDLVTYRDVNPNGDYIIVAGGPNDPLAVFDGSVIPSGIDDLPTLLYTSVSSLPIHWTLPYTPGSESQSLAVTHDGGHQFDKLARPPVIPLPPAELDVTAFRDPYVFQNGALDEAVDSASDTWYAAISGGVHSVGPGMFLYRNEDPSYENWEYLGEWWQEPENSTWGDGTWAKRFGYNFETGNVLSLDENGYNVHGDTFATFGVEGAYAPIQPSVTSMHAMLWAAGDVSVEDGGNVTFTPNMVGALDWGGAAYAAAGKVLPSTSQASQKSGAPDRFVSFIWLTGDEFGAAAGFPAAQQGWQNTLLLPRELTLHTIPNVVDNELVHETASWRVAEDGSDGCCGGIKLETLGIDIARETYNAIVSSSNTFDEPSRELTEEGIIPFEHSPTSRFFALEAKIAFPLSARDSGVQSGFQILASDLEWTTIYYQFSNESIVIDRSHTSAASETTPGLGTATESGRIRLFDLLRECRDDGHHDGQTGKDGDDHGKEQHGNNGCPSENHEMETLDLTIVVDNSVLEVYANSRFVVSTWVRPWYSNSTEIRFFHNGQGEAGFSDIKLHDGLYDAYPDRTD